MVVSCCGLKCLQLASDSGEDCDCFEAVLGFDGDGVEDEEMSRSLRRVYGTYGLVGKAGWCDLLD